MTEPIDALHMAREAGFQFNKYGLLQGDEDGEIDADAMFALFASLVLERAAVECDKQMEREAYGHAKHAVCCAGDAIRAIKPVLEKDNP